MILKIALGVALGMLIANNFKEILDAVEDIFNWVFDLFGKIYNGIKRIIQWVAALKWYYKLLALIIGFCITIHYEWIECLMVLVFATAYLFAVWAIRGFTALCNKTIHKGK